MYIASHFAQQPCKVSIVVLVLQMKLTERLSTTSKVTQLLNGRAGILACDSELDAFSPHAIHARLPFLSEMMEVLQNAVNWSSFYYNKVNNSVDLLDFKPYSLGKQSVTDFTPNICWWKIWTLGIKVDTFFYFTDSVFELNYWLFNLKLPAFFFFFLIWFTSWSNKNCGAGKINYFLDSFLNFLMLCPRENVKLFHIKVLLFPGMCSFKKNKARQCLFFFSYK